jgi:hypothetical protein
MVTLLPFGASILFPSVMLGVKKLTFENGRPQAFSFFYAAMISGAILGGPIVDLIRHDFKFSTWEYSHINEETGQEEIRVIEFSCWRSICFFGLLLNLIMQVLLCFYDANVEKRFLDASYDQNEIDKIGFFDIFIDLLKDYKFWRFLLFSFILVGPKLVFSLLFFMLPKIVM